MENIELTENIIDIQKQTVENTLNAVTLIQDQTERASNNLMEHGVSVAEQGHQAFEEWIKEYKRGRSVLKKTLEDNFNNLENLVNRKATRNEKE